MKIKVYLKCQRCYHVIIEEIEVSMMPEPPLDINKYLNESMIYQSQWPVHRCLPFGKKQVGVLVAQGYDVIDE